MVYDQKYIYTCYYIKCIDHTYEGILAYSFVDKNTEFHLTIFGVYLPPKNSFHGRDGYVLFNLDLLIVRQ